MSLRMLGLLLAMMLTFVTISTVTVAQPIVGWGLKLGMTRAVETQMGMTRMVETQMGERYTYDFASRTGVNAGVFVEWFDHPWLSVDLELYYNQKGYTCGPRIAPYDVTPGQPIRESSRLDYLSVAVLPKARLQVGAIEVYALAGPRVDFSIGRVVTESSDIAFAYHLPAWKTQLDKYKNLQLGGDFALGCTTDVLLPFDVGVETRYSLDLTHSSEFSYYSTKNHSWEFMVVVAF